MKNKLLFSLLCLVLSNAAHADSSYSLISLATTQQDGVDTLDFRHYQRAGSVSLHYSFAFIGGRELSDNVPTLMLGLGLQLPWQKRSPYFYGLGAYLVIEDKDCDSGSLDQQAECIDRQNSSQWDVAGNYVVIQPEGGIRLKLSRHLWFVSTLRYWFSNEKSLDNQLGLSLGVQF